MDPNLVSALIGGVSALLGSAVGGFVTYKVQKQSIDAARLQALDDRKHAAQVKAEEDDRQYRHDMREMWGADCVRFMQATSIVVAELATFASTKRIDRDRFIKAASETQDLIPLIDGIAGVNAVNVAEGLLGLISFVTKTPRKDLDSNLDSQIEQFNAEFNRCRNDILQFLGMQSVEGLSKAALTSSQWRPL